MKQYNKAILPKGFTAQALSAGIKKSGKLDLALFYSQVPAKAAATFTANKVQAAPLKVSKLHLRQRRGIRAIIVNSGNANCFTGTQGLKDAEAITKVVADALGVSKENILIASTGIIGKRLPLLKIKKVIPQLVRGLSKEGIAKAKKAIMTTDTFVKEITIKIGIGGEPVTICGTAKGSGMIAPNMATMLSFIFTDANITQRALTNALKMCVNNSFNCITVDGCMSTNDIVSIMANGAAGNKRIDLDNNFTPFCKALYSVCLELAKMIVRDGEGATKFIKITVSNAQTTKEAKSAALAIANSNLFKTAVYGSSTNIIGRMVASIGAAGIEVDEKDLKIKFRPLHKKDINIEVSLGRGNSRAVVYTSDLSPEYVKINAEYN